MKITLVNSLSDQDYWYDLRKILQFVLKIYTFIYPKNIRKSERTALIDRIGIPLGQHEIQRIITYFNAIEWISISNSCYICTYLLIFP
jgi:hypothetical protein